MAEESAPFHFMIVEARFYENIADELAKGAIAELDKIGATYERVAVPGCLELPGAIHFAIRGMEYYMGRRRFDAYIVLGCVIRGETSHYDYVCAESMRGLQDLVLKYSIALGNGVLTCENDEQALARARMNGKNKGGDAAKAAIAMLDVKRRFGMYPR